MTHPDYLKSVVTSANLPIVGAICGDILGSNYETNPFKDPNLLLCRSDDRFTDDTVCTIAVADAIMNHTDVGAALRKWCRKYRGAGYGGRFKRWFQSDAAEPYNSWGNGSAMRVSAAGALASSLENAIQLATASAMPTHNHPEGVKGAQATAAAIYLAKTGASKQKIRDYISDNFGYDLTRRYADIQPTYWFDVSCQGSVPESIICFLEGSDYEDTIRHAIAMGGDSDTMACIAGSIAAAFYREIPKPILTHCMALLPEDMKEILSTVAKGNEKDTQMGSIAPKNIGKLDMVIAFDTTGSMAEYIDAVRREVAQLIPQLFKDNEDLRLGIVAFGDYCDMKNSQEFGDAFQRIQPTDNENELIRFVSGSRDTSGGDFPEFYELVIRKIVEETPWREGSTRSILLIADAVPHELGYTYSNYVINNRIDWREEARKAADMKIKIDTVTITDESWFRELSAMTNGVSVPFSSGYKTVELVKASVMSRGSMKARHRFDELERDCKDEEIRRVYASYRKERDSFES